MSVLIPTIATIKANLVAAVRQKLQAALPGGTPIPPTFAVGDPLDALTDAQALDSLQFYGQLDYVQRATTLGSAQDQDLLNLVALVGYAPPDPAQASIPVLFGQTVADNSTQTVPTNLTVYGKDSTGAYTIPFVTQQDPTASAGVAGTKPPGVAGAWVITKAVNAGSNANLPAGSFGPGSLGGSLPWADYVANPPVSSPNAPTLSGAGSTGGSTTYQYQVVALGVPVNGVSGVTLPSATGQTTTGLATLTSSNKITVSWTMPGSGDSATTGAAQGFAVLKWNSGHSAWELLGMTASGVFSLDDTGQATTTYPTPLANTTNRGVGGVDQESNDDIRTNAPLALKKEAKGTPDSIVLAAQGVSGVQSAYLQDAGENGQAAGTVTVFFVPTAPPATPDLTAAVQAEVDGAVAGGIIGTASPLTLTTVNVTYSIAVAGGVSGSSVVPQIANALAAYFAGLGLGDPVRYSQIVAAIATTPNVAGLTAPLQLTLGSTTYTSQDVPGTPATLYGLGTITSTVTT